jgi:CubicO group peptidase (beta-lactamase class C family)
LATAKPEDVGVSAEKVEKLADFMQSLVDDGKIAGGVTMMARRGKVVHLKAVGMADRETNKPMIPDAIFRIASMSKPVISVGTMILWEEGELDLDDPVSKFIPAFKNPKVLVSVDPLQTKPASREITIRDLLTHTSGLGFTNTEKIGPLYKKHGIQVGCLTAETTLAENTDKLAELPLSFQPGSNWQYGMSVDVLGSVIENLSGTSLDRFVAEKICQPLGMTDTYFRVPGDKLPRLASLYTGTGDSMRRVKAGEILELSNGALTLSSDYPYAESNKYLAGGSGLCSTASDYMRFCQMILNGGRINAQRRLLKEETVEMMTTNQISELTESLGVEGFEFGFGFAILPDSDSIHEQLRGSCSWGGLWNTGFRISPSGDWVVITMSQIVPGQEGSQEWAQKFDELAAESIEQ